MDELAIFTAALEIKSPWFIERVHFKVEYGTSKLYIKVCHTRRTKFSYKGKDCPIYDHQDRSWKRMNYFKHE